MPELPEVEITCQGIRPHITGKNLTTAIIRNRKLRFPVPDEIEAVITGESLHSVTRRAKYILLNFTAGSLIIHLGMSGSLRITAPTETPALHDHVDLIFESHTLRLRDPRRFGLLLWQQGDAFKNPLLSHLGIEPLDEKFNGQYLYTLCKNRRAPIKHLLMDGHKIVGIGNIYASESLFWANIHPLKPAGKLSLKQCEQLTAAIKNTLAAAIKAGGSTLKDFVGGDGKPGYFQQQYRVYSRQRQPCFVCSNQVERIISGQRATFFCPHCQPE